jgi:hypothetical protein
MARLVSQVVKFPSYIPGLLLALQQWNLASGVGQRTFSGEAARGCARGARLCEHGGLGTPGLFIGSDANRGSR